jgi:hypothetical protein
MSKTWEHYHHAARHHERAAYHYKEAAKYDEAEEHEKAAHHAYLAHGHNQHAIHHNADAASSTPSSATVWRRPLPGALSHLFEPSLRVMAVDDAPRKPKRSPTLSS